MYFMKGLCSNDSSNKPKTHEKERKSPTIFGISALKSSGLFQALRRAMRPWNPRSFL